MKKLLSAALASLMLLGGSSAVFADEAPAVAGLTLADTSHLVLDTEKGYVDMIDGTITVADLKAEFASAVTVTGKDGVKADDKAVATDDTVSAGDDSLKALIYGDVDRNGKITLTDASGIMKLSAKWDADINTDAADVDKNGKANLADASKLLKFTAGWDDISLGNVRMVFENKFPESDPADPSVDIFFTSAMNKLGQSAAPTGEYSYKMTQARRETESCQVFLLSDTDMEGLTLELSPFEHEYGEAVLEANVFRGYYYTFAQFNTLVDLDYQNFFDDSFPEVLIPNNTPFELSAGKNQEFMISVTTDENTPEGMYFSTLSVKNAEGVTLRCATVYTYVWDFTLPVATSSASAFGLSGYSIYTMDGRCDLGDPESCIAVFADYYEFLLDYNLTPSELPYDVMDDRADAYMSDPRVTSFRAFPEMATFALTEHFGNGNIRDNIYDPDEMADRLVAYMDKINSRSEWAEKAYFTILDEPCDMDTYNRIKNVDDWMRDVLEDEDGSEYRLMLCMAHNHDYDNSENYRDAMQYLIDGDFLDMWCPQSLAYTDHGDTRNGVQRWSGTRSFRTYGSFAERIVPELEAGKELWWYICCSPMIPYPNYFIYYQGAWNKVVMWQQYLFGIEGLLYWDTTNQLGGSITKYRYGCDGDGQLIFIGDPYGAEGPIPSYRLIQVRDSFDDFDYMSLAEEYVGRERVLDAVTKVTTGILDFNEDYRVMEAQRLALAKLILENK